MPAPAPFRDALPFWSSLGLIPLAALAAWAGGWTWVILPASAWWLVTGLDLALGTSGTRAGERDDLRWYRAITLVWVPLQATLVFGAIAWATSGALSGAEAVGLFFGIGVVTGTVGMVYAHELLHQRPSGERWLGDLLLAMTLYSHFRSEHVLVHHAWVGTPRDAVTARRGEGFPRFFARVLRSAPRSAWRAEAARLARAGRPVWSARNPFWRYAALQAGMLALAFALGGWAGVALLAWQALVAVWQLELTNYVEHYGLTRRHLGGGHYEPVGAHHAWNAGHQASNALLINVQRHSDHHIRPDRRFPLLESHGPDMAPQLPMGYPAMTLLAMVPPLWRRRMHPRLRAWRRQFYPDITDWTAYDHGTLPIPRGP